MNVTRNRFISITVVLLLTITLVSCSDSEKIIPGGQKETSSIEKIIDAHKETEGDTVFNLKNFQDVEWDALHIFAPYTPHADIEKQIRTISSEITDTNIDVRDDICLLIFSNNGQVASVLPYERQKADFSRIPTGTTITKEESFFRLLESSDENGWFYVELLE